MAFDINKFVNDQKTKKTGGFDVNAFVEKQKTKTGGFDISGFVNKYTGGKSSQTVKELQTISKQSGLEEKANKILSQKGEDPQKIFSGGFISDVFDGLNALQYGVTGLLKGKSFSEGVKTRQSFSDKDSLGKYGLVGTIGGVLADIAVDPLTYVAPWTALKKIGVAQKLIKATKWTGETKLGKFLGDKFIYMFGADPIYKDLWERSLRTLGVSTQGISKMAKDIYNLAPETAQKLLTKDATGRFARTGIKELQGVLKPEEFTNVKNLYDTIDNLGKEAVDLGLLSKTKFEENIGQYLKNAYTEYETAKGKNVFGYLKKKITGIKARKDLTPEQIAKLGQIDKPAYLLFKSAFDLAKDVENAKFFKAVSEKFGSDVAGEGLKQLPKTRNFVTSTGKQVDILTSIKEVNTKLKPIFSELKKTFGADKKILSEISKTENKLIDLGGKRADEITKFFQEGTKVTKVISPEAIIQGVGKLPEELKIIGSKVKEFDNLKNLLKSDIGIDLEKLWSEGVLERNGFKTLKSFFEYVKNPYSKGVESIKSVVEKGNIPKIINLQTNIEKLISKSKKLKEIDKRSLNDSFRNLEENINILTGKKEGLVEELGKVKLGDLSGKFVPENIYNHITDILQPVSKGLGEKIMGGFKFAKVILNPATHARNVISNQILNWWKLGLGPWRQDLYLEALGQMKNGGKFIDEAKKVGYGLDTFASNEIKDMLLGPEGKSALGKLTSKIGNGLTNLYQGEENFAKLAAYIFKRKQGLGIEEAWKAAESATFNYAQVTPFVRKLRTSIWGYPFITFAIKSAPTVAETAVKSPGKISVFGKVKTAIENMSDTKETAREKASEPSWIRDGFYIKLPMKDKQGRSAYFDLTYIIPFGDLMSGQFAGRQTSRETGLPESVASSALSNSPLFNVVKELSKNQDFYGDKIWKESDGQSKQLGDIMRYLSKTYLPPLISDQIPGGYIQATGERRIKGVAGALKPGDQIKQQRNLFEEMLRNLGIKIQPIDTDIQETYMNYEKQKALETMLLEENAIKEFKKTYVPK